MVFRSIQHRYWWYHQISLIHQKLQQSQWRNCEKNIVLNYQNRKMRYWHKAFQSMLRFHRMWRLSFNGFLKLEKNLQGQITMQPLWTTCKTCHASQCILSLSVSLWGHVDNENRMCGANKHCMDQMVVSAAHVAVVLSCPIDGFCFLLSFFIKKKETCIMLYKTEKRFAEMTYLGIDAMPVV